MMLSSLCFAVKNLLLNLFTWTLGAWFYCGCVVLKRHSSGFSCFLGSFCLAGFYEDYLGLGKYDLV